MQSLIDTSTAFYGAGNSTARRQLKLRSGPYAGRKIVVYNSSPTTIKFAYADAPYTSWSLPVEITNAAADYPSSCCLDDSGNVHAVYTKQTTFDLAYRKLTFNAGIWSVGSEVVVYSDKDNYFPSISIDPLGRLHVSFTSYDSGGNLYYIRHKRSLTGGDSWGGGPTDPGDELTGGSLAAYSQLVRWSDYTVCVYTDGATKLAISRLLDGTTLWESEIVAYTGVFLSDRFAAAASDPAAILGIAFEATGRLNYIEYDGAAFSGVFDIAPSPTSPPLLLFNGANPCVIYGVDLGAGQTEVYYRVKTGVGFTAAAPLTPELRSFAWVYVYDDSAAQQYAGRVSEAANLTAADLFHPTSGKLLEANNDALFLGADAPFAEVNFILSTAGSGGVVSWAYWNGTSWESFTPSSGAYHFDQNSKRVRLWIDSASAPSDWQTLKIENKTAYWIKITVTTPFVTAPIGTQVTPLPQINYLNN